MDRALGVALGIAMVGMVLWVRNHARITGELLGKGSASYCDQNPRTFRFVYASYGVIAILGVAAVVCVAVGLGPF